MLHTPNPAAETSPLLLHTLSLDQINILPAEVVSRHNARVTDICVTLMTLAIQSHAQSELYHLQPGCPAASEIHRRQDPHVQPPGSAFMGCFLIFLTRVSLGSKPASFAPYAAQLGDGSM